ncbi:MAG: sugar ABC transporter substrate-binding protein [Phycisphaerae bacterium]|jgi:ribose transport system substrate-binding protein|nr:sugar ABC transporter substrate-binding protein [Phycisphaerae bacterium]
MHRVKSCFWIIAIAATAILAGCRDTESPEGKKLVYGFLTPGPDTYYKKNVEGFQYAAGLGGTEVIVLNSNYDVEKEIANIESLILQGVDGMCVFTFNESGANIAAKKCARAKIPLVVIDNFGEVLKQNDDVVACIDFDWEAMGSDWADYIAKTFPGENIAMVTGLFESVPVQKYRSTFEPRVKELGKNKIVAIRDGKYDPSIAANQAQDLIESGEKFSVLLVGNEDMAAAIVRMLSARQLLNNPIKIITVNGSPVGIPLVSDGSINYTVSSSPGWEGMISFLALHAHLKGKIDKINQRIILPMTAVTQETVNDKTKIVPWDVDPVWLELTAKLYPEYNGLY